MRKKVLLLFVIIAIVITLALTWFMFYGRNDANMVLKIPSGFVHLQSNLKNGLSVMPFETQIAFLDADGVGIYQTGFKNSDFIVKYKGEYYVNEEKLLELIDIAAISPEQRRKIYNLSDEVEVRGAGETIYIIKIISLEIGETEPYYEDALTTYNIKYAVTSNIAENEQIRLISSVETEYGVVYDSLNFIDAETISVKIRARGNDKIKVIILKSPDYPGLTYKVAVDE